MQATDTPQSPTAHGQCLSLETARKLMQEPQICDQLSRLQPGLKPRERSDAATADNGASENVCGLQQCMGFAPLAIDRVRVWLCFSSILDVFCCVAAVGSNGRSACAACGELGAQAAASGNLDLVERLTQQGAPSTPRYSSCSSAFLTAVRSLTSVGMSRNRVLLVPLFCCVSGTAGRWTSLRRTDTSTS